MQSGNAAFVTPAVVACGSFVAGAATCSISAPPATVAPAVTMRCRRDLKKEKSLRNLEYARQHRKKAPSRYNRRSAQQEQNNGDNEYLSDIYGTLTFDNTPEDSYRGGRRFQKRTPGCMSARGSLGIP